MVLSVLPKGGSYTRYEMVKKNIYFFNKFNQHACTTIGENKNVFVITTLGMRVDPSLLVFNLR